MKIDEIIAKIKEGSYYTVACSMYEETVWYKDGSYYRSVENGIEDPIPKKIPEVVVKRIINCALKRPDMYDGFFE